MTLLSITALVLAAAGVALLLFGAAALRRRRPLRALTRTLQATVFLALAALLGALALGMQGYRALTHEEVAARVRIESTGPQRFVAHFRFADGREERYALAGDELYVDAHILKWKPVANILGLHTAYELDRVAGRYAQLEEERGKLRTIHALGRAQRIDLFDLRRRYRLFGVLVDAQYGSATFAPAAADTEIEVRVSTSGLLIRPVGTGM